MNSSGTSGLHKFPDHFPLPSTILPGAVVTFVVLLCFPGASSISPSAPCSSSSFCPLQASAFTKIITKSWKLAHEVSLSDPGLSHQDKWRADRTGGGGTVSPAAACGSSRLWKDCRWSYKKTSSSHTHAHTWPNKAKINRKCLSSMG